MLNSLSIVASENREGGALVERVHEIAERLAPGFEIAVDRRAGDDPPEVHINGRPIGPRVRGGVDPPPWMIEAALVHALEPRHILFLCVANSARSQMADAMARALAPPEVTISSAGSAPSHVRPEALAVLTELGVDADRLRSKGVEEIDADSVQLVVTLCAEEVCPALLRPVPAIHWAMPDPAAVEGEEPARLAAFRDVRDALRERLYVMFHG